MTLEYARLEKEPEDTDETLAVDTSMTLEYARLEKAPRLLLRAELKPIQGDVFQPTGFPDLGPARYQAPRKTGKDSAGRDLFEEVEMLLVESNQSVSNWLEAACWDKLKDNGNGDFIDKLDGLPFVRCVLPNGRVVASPMESHRLNSPYFMATSLQKTLCDAVGYAKGKPWSIRNLAGWLFRHDPNTLIHGVFFSSIHDGRMRLPRALSGFIEAELGSRGTAESGFARREDADPSGAVGAVLIDSVDNELLKTMGYEKPADYKSKLKDNVKNIIGPRTEFTARRITAFFNLDLSQLRSFGLGETPTKLLIALSLFKVQQLLDEPLRLRTRCDLIRVDGVVVEAPTDFPLPSASDLLKECHRLIKECKSTGAFGDKPTTVVWGEKLKAVRKVVAELPMGTEAPTIPDELKSTVKWKKATKTTPPSIEFSDDAVDATKQLFPGNAAVHEAIAKALMKVDVELPKDTAEPTIPEALAAKLTWSKGSKNKAPSIQFTEGLDAEAAEAAKQLFPDNTAVHEAIAKALEQGTGAPAADELTDAEASAEDQA